MLSACNDDQITFVRVYVALNYVDKWRKNGHDAILHFPRLPLKLIIIKPSCQDIMLFTDQHRLIFLLELQMLSGCHDDQITRVSVCRTKLR